MPRKTKAKSKRKRKQNTARSLICRSMTNVLPDTYTCYMTYADQFQFSGAEAHTHVWRMNSVFDPDYTGVGHQPRYFDQMAALYNRYRVDACKAIIRINNRTSNSGIVALLTADNTNSAYPLLTALELPHRSKVLNLSQSTAGAASGTISQWFSPRKVTGVSPSTYKGDQRFQAIYSVNPSEAIGIGLTLESTDNSTNISASATVQLIYRVTWFDRQAVAAS